MPYVRIQTNSDFNESGRERLLHDISTNVSKELGKSESYVMVEMGPKTDMIFGGSAAACAFIELKSISLPHKKTTVLAKLVCDLIETHLGVPPDRTYIEFSDAERSLWGWNSGTF